MLRPHRHANITANILQFTEIEVQRIDLKQEKIIGVLPFYHVYVSLRKLVHFIVNTNFQSDIDLD